MPINSPQDYIARAAGLVNDLSALDALHKNLRVMIQKTQTIKTKAYTTTLEKYYLQALQEKFKA